MRRRPGRVLVIDDERAIGNALGRVISMQHQVEVVAEARAALARLFEGDRFDVILCDLRMPAMDGIEFHEVLTMSMPEEAARIVFMTGGTLSPRAEAFFAQVSNTLVDKPLDVEGLLALIDRRIAGTDRDSIRVGAAS